jgi:hypothetical protein
MFGKAIKLTGIALVRYPRSLLRYVNVMKFGKTLKFEKDRTKWKNLPNAPRLNW